jgi:hypothetical protein
MQRLRTLVNSLELGVFEGQCIRENRFDFAQSQYLQLTWLFEIFIRVQMRTKVLNQKTECDFTAQISPSMSCSRPNILWFLQQKQL